MVLLFSHHDAKSAVAERIFILLFLLTFGLLNKNISAQPGFTEATVLETTNSFAGSWSCINDGYIYGSGPTLRTLVLRKRETGQSYETRGNVTALDPDFRIENRIYSTTTPGLIFILVRNPENVHYLLKSSDGGLTMTNVFTFGEGNGPDGTNVPNVRLLRGMLELTRDIPSGGGKGTLFIGEYNISRNRVSGSTNDRVRIMKSVDNGDTWSKVVEWNTNGSNQVGHIHAMKQDPYTGEIYVCIGDYGSRTGIIKWDGTSRWVDNRSIAQTGQMSGFRAYYGAQKYRTCDLLFDEDYFYTFVDTQLPNNPGGVESGIWRGRKNFSSYNRVDNQIYDYDPMHVGWFGEKIGNTFIFTTAREYMTEAGWKELNTQVYTSTNGTTWHRSGSLSWRDTGIPTESQYITSVFSHNDKIYFDCFAGAGHSATVQCSVNKRWHTYEDPVILHPVYFVGTWNNAGNDANRGTNPDAPRRTLNSMLSTNSISAAARVRVSAGTYNEPNIHPLWNTVNFQGRGSVVIEGQGMNRTSIVRSSGTGYSYGILAESSRILTDANTPLIFKDLEMYVTVDAGTDHSNHVFHIINANIKTFECRIGNPSNDDSPLIKLEGEGAKYESENSVHISGAEASPHRETVRFNAPNTSARLRNNLIRNGHNAFTLNHPGNELILENSTIYGIANSGVQLGTGSNSQPLIRNCIFSTGGFPVEDLSGITETDIDYNLYNRANHEVTDGGHGPAIGTDPGFRDPLEGDFNLRSNSPCALIGLMIGDVFYDILNRRRSDPPSIGAYESPALNAAPVGLTVDSKTGSSANFSVTSNMDWTISEFDNWIGVSMISGTGNSNVTIVTNSDNTTLDPRNTRLAISASDAETVYVNITQSPGELTSEEDTGMHTVIVYPNPVHSVLLIDYGDDVFTSVTILNAGGALIRKLPSKGKMQEVDFSGFNAGMYFIELVQSGGVTKKFKIIKQ